MALCNKNFVFCSIISNLGRSWCGQELAGGNGMLWMIPWLEQKSATTCSFPLHVWLWNLIGVLGWNIHLNPSHRVFCFPGLGSKRKIPKKSQHEEKVLLSHSLGNHIRFSLPYFVGWGTYENSPRSKGRRHRPWPAYKDEYQNHCQISMWNKIWVYWIYHGNIPRTVRTKLTQSKLISNKPPNRVFVVESGMNTDVTRISSENVS